MWLNPLKGAHLTLGQLDKTLPVDIDVTANKGIERGSFVYIKAYDNGAPITPRFALYTATEAAKPNAVPYIALMDAYDYQAGMAGNIDQAPKTSGAAKAVDANGNDLVAPTDDGNPATADGVSFIDKKAIAGAQDFTGPRITAISVVQPAEFETNAVDFTGAADYYVGEPLTIADGKLTHFTTGHNIVGYVTAKPYTRWVNNLGASKEGARISGGNAKVLAFSTAWIPVAATASNPAVAGDSAKPLAVGAPKVEDKSAAGKSAAGKTEDKPQGK